MIRALAMKEWRETWAFGALALGVYLIYLGNLTGLGEPVLRSVSWLIRGADGKPTELPFIQDNFASTVGFVGCLLAIALGFRQSAWEPHQGTSLYLLHLPLPRRTILALAAFLALDGPLAIVDGLLHRFEAFPAGRLALERDSAEALFAQTADALKLALRAAAPPAVALATAGVALGWLGRLAPSVPLMTLSLPIRAALGVVLVMASLAGLAACLDGAWAAWAAGGY